MTMRALVAGGAGFVGSHLCDALLAEGFEVVCVDSLVTSYVVDLKVPPSGSSCPAS